jgi:hypothetical protein
MKPTQPLHNADKTQTLAYVCKATVTRHGAKGVLYRHRWKTGAQDLVFESHKQAAKWINPLGPAA